MGKCSPLLETDTELVLNLIQRDQVSLGDVPVLFVESLTVMMFGGQGNDSNLLCDLRRIATLVSSCLKPLWPTKEKL
jgi:hypothetical protein